MNGVTFLLASRSYTVNVAHIFGSSNEPTRMNQNLEARTNQLWQSKARLHTALLVNAARYCATPRTNLLHKL